MKSTMRNHKIKLLSLVILLLSGCSGGTPNAQEKSDSTSDGLDKIEIKNPVFMDDLGVVPTTGSYIINVNNLGDKHYTLDSVKITDSNGNDKSDLLSVSSKMCQQLIANGSCSIEFSPKTATSATLLMTVNLRDGNNKPIHIHQAIRVSDSLVVRHGVSFATELVDVVTEKGDYRITVPVVLNEDFDKVEAFNGSLLCNGKGFKKGNTCTYMISGHALLDNTIVSAKISAYQGDNLVSEQTDNINVRIATIPHLVMSQGIKLQANGESEALITIYNRGTVDASGISYDTNVPNGQLTSDSCKTVAPDGMCEIKLKSLSETHGVANVAATYDGGRKVSTRVVYTGTTNAELKLEETGDSLENILLGENANRTIKISNIGKNELQSFKVNLLSSDKTLVLNSSECSNGLAAGKECSVTINYTPTHAHSSGKADIVVTAKYKGVQGQLNSYTTRSTLQYSAIDSGNILSISSPTNMKIIADNQDITNQDVTINRTNAGSLDVILDPITLNKDVNQLFIVKDKSTCVSSPILSEKTPSCITKLSYGPVTNTPNKAILESAIALSVKYSIGTKKDIAILSSTFSVRAESANAIIRLQSVTESFGNTIFKGKGTITDPYSFIALSVKDPLVLTYKFKNEGNIEADNVSIGAGSAENMMLPYGAAVKTNSCGSENKKINLATQAECSISLIIPDPDTFNDIAHTGSTLPIHTGFIALPLSISYTDKINGQHTDLEKSKFVGFTRNWAGITYTTKSITKTNEFWRIVLQATVNPGDYSHYPIKIDLLKKVNNLNNDLDEATNLQGCEIQAASNKSCDLSFDLPANRYPESGEIQVDTEITSANLDAKDVIHASHNVEYNLSIADGYVSKMWAQPTYNGIISHGAGESLAFEVTFNRPAQGSELKAEFGSEQKSSKDLKLEILSNDCSNDDDLTNSCVVKGLITMPTLVNGGSKDNMVPEVYVLDLNLSLTSKDSTTTQTVNLHESGQYVQTFDSLGTKVGGELKISKNFYPLDPVHGFVVNLDSVLLNGPVTTEYDVGRATYSALSVRATSLTNSKYLQELTVYAARSNGCTIRSLGQSTSCEIPNIEFLYISTTIPDRNMYTIYRSIGNNPYSVYSQPSNPQADLNANVPAGHYAATFYFVRNGKPIKIDLDWDKK